MKINIKKLDQIQITKDLMIAALILNTLVLIMRLALNIYAGKPVFDAVTTDFIFILIPIMYLAEEAEKNKEADNQ